MVLWPIGFLLINAPGVQADLTQKIRLIQMQPDKLEFFWYLPSGQLQAKGELIQVRKYAPDPKTSPVLIPFHGPK